MMTSEELYKLRFPIGAFDKPDHISATVIDSWITCIEQFPKTIEDLTRRFKYRGITMDL